MGTQNEQTKKAIAQLMKHLTPAFTREQARITYTNQQDEHERPFQCLWTYMMKFKVIEKVPDCKNLWRKTDALQRRKSDVQLHTTDKAQSHTERKQRHNVVLPVRVDNDFGDRRLVLPRVPDDILTLTKIVEIK